MQTSWCSDGYSLGEIGILGLQMENDLPQEKTLAGSGTSENENQAIEVFSSLRTQ